MRVVYILIIFVFLVCCADEPEGPVIDLSTDGECVEGIVCGPDVTLNDVQRDVVKTP